jgi:MFS family permease
VRGILTGPTFASLQNDNYRAYFIGQLISVVGMWMQVVSLSWLVLDLTGSGTSLGLVVGSRFLPVLLLGPWGGLLSDRMDKRTVLRRTQTVTAVLAILLGVLVMTDAVELWMVYAVAVSFGLVNVIDGPARQTFISEMVGPDHIRNAVTLNSVMIYIAQIVGPALAGAVISGVGIGVCFVINGVTSLAVLVSFHFMDESKLMPAKRIERAKGQIREGLRYVRRSPELLATMAMITVGGIFAWEFQITVPLMAKEVFEGDAGTVGLLMSFMGVGAVIGGLFAASRPTADAHTLALACMLWGFTLGLMAIAPTLAFGAVAMAIVGFGTISFSATSKSTLQLQSAPHMRGRVTALWSVAVGGTTPLGAPIVGWIGENLGARWSMVAGAVPVFVVGLAFYLWSSNRGRAVAPADDMDGDLSAVAAG